MLLRAATLLILAAWALPSGAEPGATRPEFGPRPPWVEPLEPAKPSEDADLTGGVEYLVVDDQVRIQADSAEHWARRSRRITSLQGVDSESQFQLDWDPEYETLVIHSITVRRDGALLDRLDPSSIDVVRREPAFEASLLDGTLSALVVIPDVRVGDVVEHEYTVSGRNPIFAGHWFGGFSFEWGVSVRRLGFRVLWPEARRLTWKSEGTDAEPALRVARGEREARWLFEDPSIVEWEGDEPAWFFPGGGVSISEFASWQEVARWAAPLYAAPKPSGELAKLVARLREAGSLEDQALAAIRFVQDDVRYLGLEIGTGTHRPSPPEIVLERRFGDCKDKTLLLVTLLRGLGIEADAALVSTTWLDELETRLPSPGAFDHVIVRFVLDGRESWVDPTISAQRGRLGSRHVPRLGRALVVRDDTTSLSEVRPAPGDAPWTEVEARYVLPTVGGPGSMTMRTTYHGRDADDVRASLSGESREQTERTYRDYYARIHPGLESARPLVIRDDEDANVLVTEEAYRIPSPWALTEDESAWVMELRAPEIENLLVEPERSEREFPLAIDHPRHVRHRFVVELPGDWEIEEGTVELESPAATFKRSVEVSPRRLEVTTEWRTDSDWIPPGEAPRHVSVVRRAFELCTVELTADANGRPLTALAGSAPPGFPWSAVALALVTAASSAGFGLVLLRRRAGIASDAAAEDAGPDAGPGAVLALAVMLALLVPALLAWSLLASLPPHGFEAWQSLTVPGVATWHPLAAPLLLLTLVLSVSACVLSLMMLPALLLRRRAFLAIAGTALALGAATVLLRAAGGRAVPLAFPGAPGLATAAALAAACLLAIVLLSRSRRLRLLLSR